MIVAAKMKNFRFEKCTCLSFSFYTDKTPYLMIGERALGRKRSFYIMQYTVKYCVCKL